MDVTMTNADAISLIVAISSAIATGLATLAAFRSARSAESAQQALFEEQLRSGRRDIANLVSDCLFEMNRIRFLARTVRVINQSRAVFTGTTGGSRQKVLEQEVDKRVASAEEEFKVASAFSEEPTGIYRLQREDIDRLQVALTVRLAHLRTIADELDRESLSHEAQLLQHRERAINK